MLRPTLHIPSNIAESFKGTKKQIRLATRLTLEDVFNFWRRRFAPRHFTRRAFTEYKSYANSYKRRYTSEDSVFNKENITDYRLAMRIQRGKDTILPLVATGEGRKGFLDGPVRFRGAYQKISVIFQGLPKYMYMYRKKQINKHEALTEVSPPERNAMIDYAAKRMGVHMNRKTNPPQISGKNNYKKINEYRT